MKKVRIVFCFLMTLSLLLSFASALERIPTCRICPVCGTSVLVSVSRTYAHDETFPCSHEKEGVDIYHVYEYKETGTCPDCGCSMNYQNVEHEFFMCNGR